MLRLKCSRLTRFDHQFHHESKITWLLAISSLSNNSDCSICISIVSKRTQCENLQLPIGNSLSIQVLKDQSWRWAFATSFPGHCARKASWVPRFPRVTLFNESMYKKCVSNLNLHLNLNILWVISSPPPMKLKWKQWNPPLFPSCSLASVSPSKVLLSVSFLGDKSLTYTNKHNS